jgi:hypothetical protein
MLKRRRRRFNVGRVLVANQPLATSNPLLLLGSLVRRAGDQVLPLSMESDRHTNMIRPRELRISICMCPGGKVVENKHSDRDRIMTYFKVNAHTDAQKRRRRCKFGRVLETYGGGGG